MDDKSDQRNSNEHPSAARLQAFAVGKTSEYEATTIERHVAACETCRQVLEAAPNDDLLEMVVTLTPQMAPSRNLRLAAGYEILDELGRGGMGVVYRARQIALDRLVALKMIGRAQCSAEDMVRFRLEAEAAASLHHPQIVQVFDVGEQDGQPYIAMELVEGGSLAELLAQRPLAPRSAAALLETLAFAVQHAHEHGVVHRDLKPANILLHAPKATPNKAGEAPRFSCSSSSSVGDGMQPRITDFGLAKRLNAAVGNTQTGTLIGTPSYMAPEQAEAKASAIGPLVDVYALGAVLYEALAGRPPFHASNVLETLEQVRQADPVPPSRLQPNVPRDLETICLKCLEKESSRRYASAAALADDLRRFLEHRPIVARPASVWQRGAKWARRRPSAAALIVVSTLAAIGLLVGGAYYNVNLRDALASAEQERDRADENFARSFAAVDGMLEQVGFSQLADVPEMEQVRESLLVEAVAIYEQLLARQPHADAASRRRRYIALMRLGKIHQLLGHAEEAERVLGQAIDGQSAMMSEFSGEPTYVQDLADSHVNLGLVFHSEHQKARAQYRRAIELLEPIADRAPQCRIVLASALSNLATITLDAAQSERLHQQALARRSELASEHSADPARRHDLGQTLYNLAMLYFHTGRNRLAEEDFAKAIEIWERLTEEHPRVTAYQSALADCYMSFGSLLSTTGRTTEGEALLRKAIERQATLAERFPKVLERQTHLARGHNTLGALLMSAGRTADAAPELERALSLHEAIQRDYPSLPHRNATAETLTNLAMAYSNAGQREKAEGAFGRALEMFEEIAAEQPAEPRYLMVLGINCMNFGNLLRANDAERALKLNDRLVEALERVFASQPDRSDVRSFVLNARGARALTLSALDRTADALDDWDRVVELADEGSRRTYRLMRLATMVQSNHARAAAEAGQLADLPEMIAADRYNLACVLAQCAQAVAEDENAAPGQRDAKRDEYASRAVEILRDPQLNEFFQKAANVEHLKADPDLRPLHTNAGFQELIERLEPNESE